VCAVAGMGRPGDAGMTVEYEYVCACGRGFLRYEAYGGHLSGCDEYEPEGPQA